MNTTQASIATKFRVGIFTILGLVLIGAVTVYVNDKPFWWRSCEPVHINVQDATGLKTKSPIRSLGLQIGYLKSVELSETYVRLGICITAPVEVLPSTRAYIRSEGFLGDKFVELKPVRFTGPKTSADTDSGPPPSEPPKPGASPTDKTSLWNYLVPSAYAEDVIPSAHAEEPPKRRANRDIPVGQQTQDVQHLVSEVDGLVSEMTALTNNLKEAINPKELRQTMLQLNKTLENASRTLSPEGGLNTTAQRTLAKLEDAIEQLRDIMTRINKGEGSIGMIVNDPTYAEELREAIKNINKLLSKVSAFRFVVDIGVEKIPAYDGTRAWFRLAIWPKRDRYYLLGLSFDPRGKRSVTTTTTNSGGLTTTTQTTQVEQTGILLTGMLGKVLWDRLEVAAGALHGDGDVTAALWLGPYASEEMIQIRNDIYSRGQGFPLDYRGTLQIRPLMGHPIFSSLYLKGGIESVHKVNEKAPWFFGAGLAFDDEDIKLLFTLR